MDVFWSGLGVLGSLMCVSAYFLQERGIINAGQKRYYAMNGMGALFVLIGAAVHLDGGDWGAIIQEACWCAISAAGVYKLTKKKA